MSATEQEVIDVVLPGTRTSPGIPIYPLAPLPSTMKMKTYQKIPIPQNLTNQESLNSGYSKLKVPTQVKPYSGAITSLNSSCIYQSTSHLSCLELMAGCLEISVLI